MKRNNTIIATILTIVLAVSGGTAVYIKHLSIEFKNETKVYLNEVNINENIAVQSNSVTDKNDKDAKDYIKSAKKDAKENKITNTDSETMGRIEIPALNIKAELISSQIKYTAAGLNKAGNSVIYLENTEYEGIIENTEIYIRNAAQEKVIYKVYNIYESTLTDTSFYENNTEQIELTLVIKQSDDILVIQAREK
ncbi:MAG: hypothetical protein HFH63_05385 [Lachnospiraceae bacterium]|nr:hypothetical protein [Lachnospiraceae bacterium]MCI8825307.1 hypothetical protein [Lachnospiraceae bacterium]